MMRKLLIILPFVALLSCGEEVIEKPNSLIAKEKMVDILYDMAIINAAKTTGPHVMENRGFNPMEFIYDKYDIDSMQFVSSDLYYASQPLEYEEIYRKLEDRIKKEKDRFDKMKEQEKDSLGQDKVVE
ncbi:DUF4296 domain-containing protein [uncultured Eudoraea sp.]|uniref:DUF4296 domain-containing protein n=1 Tax=uncultured Eudoraea sp. TaxID=1035614 RepID=UPI0026311BA3|nr:DUF4296 domain-containing protein [uncultured Eudoraea sp.]